MLDATRKPGAHNFGVYGWSFQSKPTRLILSAELLELRGQLVRLQHDGYDYQSAKTLGQRTMSTN